MKFRSKPKVIEAILWDGTNIEKIREFINEHDLCRHTPISYFNRCLFVGSFAVNIGEYIVIDGDKVYKLLAELIEEQYDPIND